MVIIVCYRLDQFAFNPDFRTKEDCGASSLYETTANRGREAILAPPSFLRFQRAMKQTSPLSEAQRSHKSLQGSLTHGDKGGREDAPGHAASTRSPRSAPQGGLLFPRLILEHENR